MVVHEHPERRGPGRPRKKSRQQRSRATSSSTSSTAVAAAATTTTIAVNRNQQQTNPSPPIQWVPQESHTNPGALDDANNFQVAVLQMQDYYRADNTKEAYEPKRKEFESYCSTIYASGRAQYALFSRKVFNFMFYQMMRPKKKIGGSQRNTAGHFNVQEYKEVMAKYASWLHNPTGPPATPDNPVGNSTFVQYMMAIKGLWQYHKAQGLCQWRWDEIWDISLGNLHHVVKSRKTVIAKENYKEKLDGEFAPYQIVEDVTKIESELWKNGSFNQRSAFSWLRHRYCFLYTTRGILRAESVFNGELSDLCGLKFKKPQDPHPLEICVTQLPQGKTNHGLKLYGRCLRSKDVNECGFGALAFYLAYRFEYTCEFKEKSTESWLENESWFDVKILVDGTRSDSDFCKPMANTTYSKAVKKVLGDLGIGSNHWVHIGRVLGSKILELLEAESEGIRQLGNWNPFIQEKCYSAKLPLGPMRTAAGYTTGNGMYYCPRATVEPCDELLKATPFGWAFEAHEKLTDLMKEKEMTDGDDQRFPATAFAFIRFMMHCARVLLQDAAAMEILEPARRNHPLYQLEVFQSSRYNDFVSEMRRMLDACRRTSVVDHTIESVLPGVATKISAVHETVDIGRQETKEEIRILETNLKTHMNQQMDERDRKMASMFRNLASAYEAGGGIGFSGLARTVTAPMTAGNSTTTTTATNEGECLFLRTKYNSVNEIWRDWKGFDDSTEIGKRGGVEALEQQSSKKEWRKHFTNSQNTQLSRFKAIVTSIEKKASELGNVASAISFLDTIYQSEEVKKSLGNMNKWVKHHGLVVKKRNRGR